MVTTMGRWARAALLAAAVLAGAAGETAAQGTGRVVGRVTDASGRPVEGATVVVVVADSAGARWTARSEETGGFQLAGLPAGTYRVRVERGGYQGREEQVTVEPGGRRTVIVRLREARGTPRATARSRARP